MNLKKVADEMVCIFYDPDFMETILSINGYSKKGMRQNETSLCYQVSTRHHFSGTRTRDILLISVLGTS